jgi:hypothetical protein
MQETTPKKESKHRKRRFKKGSEKNEVKGRKNKNL